MDGNVTEARKGAFNWAATVFSGIGHSVSRFRWNEWRGRRIRHRSKYFAEYSRAKMIWLACLLCLSVFLIVAGFELCRGAIYNGTPDGGRRYPGAAAVQTGYPVSVETRTPPLFLTGGGN
ncbi:MAG: hypothetical protein LBS53_10430 [Synergistaceae bacterium]|nr:hypothetical protein [Synergistaceae bacterium]